MKIEKAIEILIDIQSDWEDGEEYEAFNAGLIALKKQIPKKAEFNNVKYTTHYNCPTCGRIFWEKSYIDDYCDSCGQRLDKDNKND